MENRALHLPASLQEVFTQEAEDANHFVLGISLVQVSEQTSQAPFLRPASSSPEGNLPAGLWVLSHPHLLITHPTWHPLTSLSDLGHIYFLPHTLQHRSSPPR